MQLQYKFNIVTGAAGGCGLSFTCCQRLIKDFGGAGRNRTDDLYNAIV